ncbi:MAG: hypothetical protein QM749_15525 [Aquabacterium sp.]
MKAASKFLTILAVALFVCALMLPALQIVVLGKDTSWEGWRATAFALSGWRGIEKNPAILLLVAAGLGNITFFFAPWLLLFGKPEAKSLRTFAVLVVGALALAVWSPHSLPSDASKPLIGYFIWLLAYIALFGGTVLLLRETARFGHADMARRQ